MLRGANTTQKKQARSKKKVEKDKRSSLKINAGSKLDKDMSQ
jgi:hypothetical protein